MPDGSVIRVENSAQYWGLSLSYPELFGDEYAYLASFIMETIRTGDTIDVLLPQYENFRVTGDMSSTVIPSGQKGSTIQILNAGGLEGRPNLNDLFKLEGHSKVYKITSYDMDTGSGTMTLGLYPKLALETTGSEKPQFNSILLEMVLTTESLPDEDPDANGLYHGFGLELREHIHG